MKRDLEIVFERVLKTQSSERYLVQTSANADLDIAAVDIHYLETGVVSSTVVILHEDYFGDEFARRILATIDSRLLPMACLNDGDLIFTVVEGKLLGQYTNNNEDVNSIAGEKG